jgi:hypothetical protein
MEDIADLRPIRAAVARARRRVRLQAALEFGTTALPAAAGGALVATVLDRPVLGVIAAGGSILVIAAVAAAWPRDDERIARRIDRASNLADRLSTALAFARGPERRDPVTAGLAELAIADGVRAAPRADPRAAAPIRRPRDAGIAALSVLLAITLAGIVVTRPIAAVRIPDVELPAQAKSMVTPPGAGIAREDVEYLRRVLGRMRAGATTDGAVTELDALDDALDAVAAGRMDRAALLAKLGDASRRGSLDGIADVIEAVRHSRPEPPPPPPPPVPPEPGMCQAPGTVHDPDLFGPRTDPDEPTKDQRIQASSEGATSRREAVLSAAKEGFSGTPYRRVYAEYLDIVEEVMTAEKVPPSHRYLIDRYFDRIRPWAF